MSDTPPLVYLIYGIPGSGRREVLFDLIDGGIDAKEQVLYFRPEDEASTPFDEQLEALDNVSVVSWKLSDAKVTHGPINAAPDKIIFLAPGRSDPADAAEALKTWVDHNDCELARILTTGILNEGRNVLGMMPHPERLADAMLGGTDGRPMFDGLVEALATTA